MSRLVQKALLLLPLIAGCATTSGPPPLDMRKVDLLVPGTSTVDEAMAILGAPNGESTTPDGSRLLQWLGTHVRRDFLSLDFDSYGWAVAILFDPEGKMVRVTDRYQARQ